MARSTSRLVLMAALATGIAMTFCQTSEAQRRGRGGMRQGHVAEIFLLQLPEVQAELKLSDEQKTEATAALNKLAAGRSEIIANVPKDSGERGPKIKELTKQAAASVDALLDEAQQKRLRELVIQVNGPNELENEEVQAALNMTDEQKDRITEVSRANAKKRRDTMENFVGDRWEKSVELQKEANQKLLDVLTPEQLKQFQAMQGEKLEIDLYQT